MKRKYDNNYPSVTDALNMLRKIGLENYFKWNTPDWLKEQSKKNLSIGTTLHEVIQSHIEKDKIEFETEHPIEVTNAIKGFFLLKKEHPEIKLKKAEIQLTSEKHKYNGTPDVTSMIKKELQIGDWKTGNCKKEEKPPIYDEHIYQLSAYIKLYNEVMKTDIKRGWITVFAKDKIAYNFLSIEEEMIDYCFEDAFLPALKICYNQKRLKKDRKEEGKNGKCRCSRQRVSSNSGGGRGLNKSGEKLPTGF